jgi:hypothetical protein
MLERPKSICLIDLGSISLQASHCLIQAVSVKIKQPEPHLRARESAVVDIPTGSYAHVEVIVRHILIVELQDVARSAPPDQAIGNAEHDDIVERKRRGIINRLACVRLIGWLCEYQR